MQESVKRILLESLKAAEKTLEKDINQDEETKKNMRYFLHFFKYLGVDTTEKLALEGKTYIEYLLHQGIHKSTSVLAKVISSLSTMLIGFLIISVGLIFGAVALSLWLGSVLGSTALGFLISGGIWVFFAIVTTKILFSKKRLEHIIAKKIKY